MCAIVKDYGERKINKQMQDSNDEASDIACSQAHVKDVCLML